MPNDFRDYIVERRHHDREATMAKAVALTIAMLLVLAVLIHLFAGPPPAFPTTQSKDLCTAPGKPEWCVEYQQDLAHGRKERRIAAMEKAASDQIIFITPTKERTTP